LIYAFKHGINGFGFKDFIPGATSVSGTLIFLGVVPLLLFNYVGFELANAAAEEMVDPQKDVPKSVIRSAIATVILYSLPIFGILVVLPTDKIKGIDGFVGAVNAVFGDVYGGAADTLVKFMVGAFIVSLITSGAVWMIGSDRVLAVASYDGAWVPWFGVFNRRLGTPVRVNTMSGVLSTVFLLFALNLLGGSNANAFEVILALTTSTTLLSYVMIFPTGWLLRRKHGHIHRPYRAPLMALCVALCTGWMVIGSWVAFVPGTLERALGFSYDYQEIWGVSFARYEAISAGIVVLIAVLTAIGYILAAPVRAQSAEVALEPQIGQGATATAPAGGD
jgi:amino acid transporter